MLETIQAGVCWPCNRVNTVLQQDTTCPLCEQPYTDEWHTYWTCPALANTEEEAIIESQHLIAELGTGQIAFYNSALIQKHQLDPGSLCDPLDDYTLQIQPHNRDITSWEIGALWPSGYYFGDGSGGRYSPPR